MVLGERTEDDVGDDANGPHVNFEAVVLIEYDLRGYEVEVVTTTNRSSKRVELRVPI